VGPTAGLDPVGKRRKSLRCRQSKRGLTARGLVTILTELPRLLGCTLRVQNLVCHSEDTTKVQDLTRAKFRRKFLSMTDGVRRA
jgi:hypothetical protein